MLRVAAALLIGALIVPAGSSAVSPGCGVGPEYHGGSPRVRLELIGGRRVFVVLPTDYATTTRRYPTVFLMHGGAGNPDQYLIDTDLLAFTEAQPPERQAIVVLPDGTWSDVWADWRDGALQDETLFVHQILPAIDATYRTIPDRRHRAIAGFSLGGLGALGLAARHPDLFAAAASLSGVVDVNADREPASMAFVFGASTAYGYCYRSPAIHPFGLCGDPVISPACRDLSPADLAPNYRGMAVSIFVGNGVPCRAQDLREMAEIPPFSDFEPVLRQEARSFHAQLTRAGVPHAFTAYPCGIHTFRYLERSLHTWWEPMFSAFGTPAPTAFDHRRVAGSFSVWGWTFQADHKRAPEFLDVTNASSGGLKLTGSGVETVTTAKYFSPGQVLALTGAVEPSATADDAGRITFHVDLGPAHRYQQYTVQERVLEARGNYFTTRIVSFV